MTTMDLNFLSLVPIPGFPDYCARYDGMIYSQKTNKLLRIQIHPDKYCYVMLYKGEEKRKNYKVHRLMAQTFIPNPLNLPKVNHKDGITTNNCIQNLEWISSKGNVIHAYETGLIKKYVRPVCQLDNCGHIVAEFPSIKIASDSTGIDSRLIVNVCKGKGHRTASGFYWRYKEDSHLGIPINKRFKPVHQYDLNGNFIKEFANVKEASQFTRISHNTIYRVCRGELESSEGYVWRYKEQEIKMDPLLDEIKTWKPVPGHDKYLISKDGRIYSKYHKKLRKLEPAKSGYVQVGLTKDGIETKFPVHQLVAKTYLPNPHHYTTVNHKNNIGSDNRIENLEWCTAQYNAQHAIDNGHNPSKISVNQYTKDGTFVAQYSSMKEASAKLGITYYGISNVCRQVGRSKTAGGYVWKYAD